MTEPVANSSARQLFNDRSCSIYDEQSVTGGRADLTKRVCQKLSENSGIIDVSKFDYKKLDETARGAFKTKVTNKLVNEKEMKKRAKTKMAVGADLIALGLSIFAGLLIAGLVADMFLLIIFGAVYGTAILIPGLLSCAWGVAQLQEVQFWEAMKAYLDSPDAKGIDLYRKLTSPGFPERIVPVSEYYNGGPSALRLRMEKLYREEAPSLVANAVMEDQEREMSKEDLRNKVIGVLNELAVSAASDALVIPLCQRTCRI